MSDDPTKTTAADRDRVSLEQPHEVQYFVESMQKDFPEKSFHEIGMALCKAAQEAGGSESRALLKEKVAAILNKE
ncbi:hypothetical protein EI77_01278 [Prosthecobacter fusiformis]|uniref:Uncharacterized protein n=1 Tax=Prosthecobacter fusiformis TaxID=48464 RepID=A0A4V3FG08_9BACT|nr:hypothetical protein [Prosthecobacter fusiformis]TDU72813.1 hypothetical protein EI77_01278 [Prosthecobacter fusiformis]